MNTKTTKFLAVLAVFAMMFAVLAVVAPAIENDADPAAGIYTTKDGTTAVEVFTITEDVTWYVMGAATPSQAVIVTSGTLTLAPHDGSTGTTITIPAESSIAGAGTIKITAEVIMSVTSPLTNDGTITNNAAWNGITVSDSGKIASSTASVKGTINGNAANGLVNLKKGEVSYQNVDATSMTGDAQPIRNTYGGYNVTGAVTVDHCVFTIPDGGFGVAFSANDNAEQTITVTNNTFNSAGTSVMKVILVGVNSSSITTFKATVTGNTFNIAGYHEKGADLTVGGGLTLGTIGTHIGSENETADNVIIDSTVKSIQITSAYKITSNLNLDLISVRYNSSAVSFTIDDSVTLNSNVFFMPEYNDADTEYKTKANGSFTLGQGAIFNGAVMNPCSDPATDKTLGMTNKTAAAANIYLKGVDANSNNVTISAGSVIVTGTIAYLEGSYIEQTVGIVQLGTGADTNALQVPAGTTLDIAGKITGNIADAGTVNLDTGVDVSDLTITTSGKGKIVDNTDEDDMEELVIGGNSQGASTEFSSEQKVIVSSELGYWTLNSGSIVKINGVLVIPEGTIMTVQADAELIIQAGAKVHVYGELVLDAKEIGNDKAGIMTVNKGFASVEGNMTVNGELSLSATDAIISEIDVENGGRVIIGEAGKFTVTDKAEFYVAAGGELLVYGTMGSTIYNSGIVTIDSEIAVTSSTKIYMWSPDASVDVKNYTIDASAQSTKLTISDKGLVFLTYKEGGEDVDVTLVKDEVYSEDMIEIGMKMGGDAPAAKNYSITFSGIEVVSGSTSKASTTAKAPSAGIYNYKQYSKYLDVSGIFFVDYTYIGTSTGDVKTVSATVKSYTEDTTYASQCGVKVTDAIVINNDVTFTNEKGVMTVTGSIDTASDKAFITNTSGATITVSKAGEISVIGGIINTENGINAAKFVTVGMDVYGKTYKIYNYYSIDGALAAVSSGVETTEIIILGTQTLTLSETLPDGITLVLSNSTASLTIKADVAFTIADTAVVKGEGTITVDGSMYAEEKTSVKGTVKVVSDVKTEELDEKGKPTKTGWALWTNLAAAIAAAEPESVITITKIGLVSISKNLTIPEDITLVIPSTSEGVILSNGVTLTINGIVIVGKDSNIYAQQAFALDAQNITSTTDDASRQSSAIVVNGALVSEKAVKYGDGYAAMNTVAGNGKKIALFDGTYVDGQKYITTGTSAATTMPDKVVAPIAGAYYTVKAEGTTYNVISSLAFAAVLVEDITSANITTHGDVSGLILDFEGTDVLKSIVIGTETGESITAPTRTDAVATELTVATLVLNDLTLNANSCAFSGIVGNGTDAITLYDAKGITVQDADDKLYINGTMTFATTDGFAVISAGTVYLGKATGFATEKTLTVGDDATAVVGNTVNITKLIVEGTFQVPASMTANITNLYDLGVVDVAATTETTSQGTLNIAASGFMYIGCDGKPAAEKTEFEIAYLNGPISFGDKATVYMMDDAIVDLEASACLLALKHTTFFIEDDEFFTEFAKGDVTLDTTIPKILDAVISKWVDEDGDNVAGKNVGAVDEVYALINYNIYSVMIVTDAGVKSVAINGIEMVNQGNNVFTLGVDEEDILTPLIAGTYKVTYTLKSGYQEDKNGVTLYTETGTVLANHSFVAGGSYVKEIIKLQLNGTEIIPEPEPVTPEEKSEWTVTTILLCVLVVLIAIMAVIVALRLNRN